MYFIDAFFINVFTIKSFLWFWLMVKYKFHLQSFMISCLVRIEIQFLILGLRQNSLIKRVIIVLTMNGYH